MRFGSACKSAAVAFLLLSGKVSAPVQAQDASTLVPFAGETLEEYQARTKGGNAVTIPPGPGGHFFVQPTINGHGIRAVIDTGASVVALTHEDAQLIGLKVSSGDFTKRVSTANGISDVAPVRLSEIRIGGITMRDVVAVVQRPGRLGVSLIGMSFLSRLSGFEASQGRLILRQ